MQMMKRKFIRKLCCFTLILTLFQGFAQENDKSIKEIRTEAMDFYRNEISAASINEISGENLGVWQEVLNASLFMLIRNNEQARQECRLMSTFNPP